MARIQEKNITLKHGAQLHIRNAQISDAAALIDYVKLVAGESTFLTFPPEEFRRDISEEEGIIMAHLAVPNRIFILGVLDGEIAGILNVEATQKSRLRHRVEFGVTVKKKHWGRGIGRRLLEEAILWAKDSPMVEKLILEVVVSNEKAVNLYKKLGFEVEGHLKRDTLIDGQYYDVYIMALFV